MESLKPTSWTLFATVALFLVALLAPVTARADNVSIAASADPVEDVTYQITVSGSTSATTHVFATFKATGGQPCAANPAADDGTEAFDGNTVSGQFSLVRNWTTSNSGTYLLCAWVASFSGANPTAAGQQVITVRAPRSSGSIAVPAVVPAGSTFQMSVTAQTEVRRYLYVDINPPGVPCAANFDANQTVNTVVDGQSNTGGPFAYTSNVTAPSSAGVYGVCGFIQEYSGETVPETRFAATFKVTSPRCPAAMRARSRYERAVRGLKRKLRGRSLRVGDRGDWVARVQRKVQTHPDGVFGAKTERAVKRFQRRHGLAPSGIVDAATRRALRLPPFISRRARLRYTGELHVARQKLAKAKRNIDQYCR